MNIISSNTAREIAKYSLDMSKLAATGAFITPCFSTKDVEGDVLTWMGGNRSASFHLRSFSPPSRRPHGRQKLTCNKTKNNFIN